VSDSGSFRSDNPGSAPPGSVAPPYGQLPYGQPTYGQPPYGQPPYGQPPYGQPAYGPYGYSAAPRTNGFAIASLCCSIGGILFVGISSILGVIFGFVARSQIRQSQIRQSRPWGSGSC
jgi:hypothetical protein